MFFPSEGGKASHRVSYIEDNSAGKLRYTIEDTVITVVLVSCTLCKATLFSEQTTTKRTPCTWCERSLSLIMLERKAKCSQLNLPERGPAAQFLATLQKCERVSFCQLHFAKGTNLNKLCHFLVACTYLSVPVLTFIAAQR